jgi:hypothetical protein
MALESRPPPLSWRKFLKLGRQGLQPDLCDEKEAAFSGSVPECVLTLGARSVRTLFEHAMHRA